MKRLLLLAISVAGCLLSGSDAAGQEQPRGRFRAGAAAVDITPVEFPVIVNGYFVQRTADRAHDRLMARALVLDDGRLRLALVVVDSLMIPRSLLDEAKRLASQQTGIPVERMLVSATHTHSAPSVMACLGSQADPRYSRRLPREIARSIVLANRRLQAAEVGWSVVKDYRHNHCRRWVFRPDRMISDPFGVRNVRAHMHPGYQSPQHIGPAGPADVELSLLALRTPQGRPLGVLANYAMHYFGAAPVSADFCGRFGRALGKLIGADEQFVGIMSQGTSGDSMWMDYSRPRRRITLEQYTQEVAQVAKEAYEKIRFRDWIPLDMAQTTLRLRRRVPDAKRLQWAKKIVARLGDRLPRSHAEVYAWEQLYLHREPEVELVLQAVRVGELGITGIPNEVYGITGLKIKQQSPLQPTFNIELANGAQGYIPPPEQHALGGYTTWPARTAGLEVQAEPKIVEALLQLLEKVSGRRRRKLHVPLTPYAQAVLDSRPMSYWRMHEIQGTVARDWAGDHPGRYEPGVAFYLPAHLDGKERPWEAAQSRAVMFAGGRMRTGALKLGETYSVEFWFWNGLPGDARPVTAYLFSRGRNGQGTAEGDHLGLGGTAEPGAAGKLIFYNGNRKRELLVGHTVIRPKTWNHVVLVRSGEEVRVYLNGRSEPELQGKITPTVPPQSECFFGGRSDGFAPLAGMMTEASVYSRALRPEEIQAHFRTARPEE